MSHARESHAGTRKGRSESRTVSGGWLQLKKRRDMETPLPS
jgi:hypothetical protein